MKLWLDDIRDPNERAIGSGWIWVKTAAEAIEVLKTGEVTVASLDHDIAWAECAEVPDDWEITKTGYAVVLWMEEHNVWPVDGVGIHSMNPVVRKRMASAVEAHYGRNFSFALY